ncbi:S9 family peptidase [uncultured Algimonas sp.]|uniref:S9 family peptidase n=1 Tax=uncultured Algimonas sp. TaxID=1547920 RepID=UPI0026089E76|nr:S9 family peptidase [uncultured Algimonas sp.]
MRHRLLFPLLLGSLAACNYGGDPVDRNDETKETVPALQQAASDALTPRTQRRSYLMDDPGPGRLTPERIHAEPSIDGPSLARARIAPDGTFVTLLKGREDDADQQDLWAYDIETGEGRLLVSSTDLLGAPEELSEEEKNRRERQRLYASGIVDYSWVGQDLLMFPLGGDIYLYDLDTEEARQVTATPAFETDPKVSRDGALVAYVREDELYVKELETGLERQLTDTATDTVRNATASFVVQEELDRDTGYWISPDATRIAYTQIDESPIAIETRANIGPDGITTIDQRYPFAGTDNATVRLGVVNTSGGETRWLDLGDDADIYLTRVAWAPDGRSLYAGVLSRDNQTHTIYRIDLSDGGSDVFYEETSETWLNIRSEFKAVENGLHLISERDGTRRYYEITADGPRPLTPSGLLIEDVLCETADGTLFVTGWRDSPVSTHIFRVDSGNDEGADSTTERFVATQIDKGEGQHRAAFNADCTRYLETFSNDNVPPQVRAFEADGTPLTWLSRNLLDDTHPYARYRDAHIEPEYGTLSAEDGSTLHYQVYKPLGLRAGERRPSVTIVYGGPGVQRVLNRWERKHLPRMLAHHGFVVFLVDGRGSSNRGKAFEDVLHRALGRAEVVDQMVGAEWLKGRDFIDPDRMGVYGWSYGGYMALMMLGQTDLYASGVAGAPVTDWALYDTAYTERYLGDPRPDHPNHTPGAYEGGSVFTWLDGLTEPVLVIHGMADDNVVFRHTVKLVDAMQKLGRHNLTLEAYPGEKHGFRATEARIHRDRSILEFFLDTLGAEENG